MKRITVFCGSSLGTDEIYEKQAFKLGESLAERKLGLVYGGASVGLMNAVANGSLSKGGEVIGVLPVFIKNKGIAHKNLTELILVETMHERKTKMNEISDGVIALPGGFGTLEEFFEVLTLGQLGLHKKPVGLLNINGFYDSLKTLTKTMVEKGFLKVANQKMLLISDDIDNLLNQLENYIAPTIDKWINQMVCTPEQALDSKNGASTEELDLSFASAEALREGGLKKIIWPDTTYYHKYQ